MSRLRHCRPSPPYPRRPTPAAHPYAPRMVCAGCAHYIRVVCAWRMVCAWCVRGVCMVCAWCVRGVCAVCAWRACGRSRSIWRSSLRKRPCERRRPALMRATWSGTTPQVGSMPHIQRAARRSPTRMQPAAAVAGCGHGVAPCIYMCGCEHLAGRCCTLAGPPSLAAWRWSSVAAAPMPRPGRPLRSAP